MSTCHIVGNHMSYVQCEISYVHFIKNTKTKEQPFLANRDNGTRRLRKDPNIKSEKQVSLPRKCYNGIVQIKPWCRQENTKEHTRHELNRKNKT